MASSRTFDSGVEMVELDDYMEKLNSKSFFYGKEDSGQQDGESECAAGCRHLWRELWIAVSITTKDIAAAFYVYLQHTLTLECFIVVVHAVLVTSFYMWYTYGQEQPLASKLDFSILSFAVVFPLTFLVQQSFARREQALVALADFRALTKNVVQAMLTWNFPASDKSYTGRLGLPDNFSRQVRDDGKELLFLIHEMLIGPTVGKARFFLFPKNKKKRNSVLQHQERVAQRINEVFEHLYMHVESMKATGLPANEASRINQYHWFLTQRFEYLRNFKYYRTPQATRSFGRVYLFALPWFFGPYFAWVAGLQLDGALEAPVSTETNIAWALCLAGFTFLVLMGLINTGRLVEDPFVENAGYDTVHLKHDIAATMQAIDFHYQKALERENREASMKENDT